MKKILFILLFSNGIANAQINLIVKGSDGPSTTNASATGFGPTTFNAGRLYLFVVQTSGTTNPGTITATSLTWTSVASVGNATNRLQVFRCVPSTDVSGESVSLGTFGGGSTGSTARLYEVIGTKNTGTNGADAIVQAPTAGPTTGTNPTITMSALTGTRNTVISFWSNNANTFGGTQETGWTEVSDLGYNSPVTGFYEMRRATTVDNTPTVTAASSTWIGVAIELQAGNYSGLPLYFF